MSSSIFREGMPMGLIEPMYDDGFAIRPDAVDPEFAGALLTELKQNAKYDPGEAVEGGELGFYHEAEIDQSLDQLPLLAEYRNTLNKVITEVTGINFPHLPCLTVRVCPVGEMSTQIHRNNPDVGPWLVALTIAGSGSFNIYSDDVIGPGEERPLRGDPSDPTPIASSQMGVGDAWGIYSGEWGAPHAGGRNTSPDPKVLVLLYGWQIREHYGFVNDD